MHSNFSINHYQRLLSTQINKFQHDQMMEGTKKFKRERGKKGHKSSHVSLIWGQSKERWALRKLEAIHMGGRRTYDSSQPSFFHSSSSPKSYIFPLYSPYPLYIYIYIYSFYLSNKISSYICNQSTIICMHNLTINRA